MKEISAKERERDSALWFWITIYDVAWRENKRLEAGYGSPKQLSRATWVSVWSPDRAVVDWVGAQH